MTADMAGQPDYYPLIAGAVLEYRRDDAAMKLEVLSVGRQDAASGSMTAVVAKCRRTWQWDGGAPEVNDVEVVRSDFGVYSGKRKLFPLPPKVGAKWNVPPEDFELMSLEERVEVPAGRFERCMRVHYLIGAGDAGDGEIFYAPGVGLVKEVCRDEAAPYELKLVGYKFPRVAP
jgi:hypothetical protein